MSVCRDQSPRGTAGSEQGPLSVHQHGHSSRIFIDAPLRSAAKSLTWYRGSFESEYMLQSTVRVRGHRVECALVLVVLPTSDAERIVDACILERQLTCGVQPLYRYYLNRAEGQSWASGRDGWWREGEVRNNPNSGSGSVSKRALLPGRLGVSHICRMRKTIRLIPVVYGLRKYNDFDRSAPPVKPVCGGV
jgi:hypothetical protein